MPLLALFFSLLSFLLALFPPSVFWNMSYLLICFDWARVLGFVRVTADWFGRTKNLHNKMLAANGGPINTLSSGVPRSPQNALDPLLCSVIFVNCLLLCPYRAVEMWWYIIRGPPQYWYGSLIVSWMEMKTSLRSCWSCCKSGAQRIFSVTVFAFLLLLCQKCATRDAQHLRLTFVTCVDNRVGLWLSSKLICAKKSNTISDWFLWGLTDPVAFSRLCETNYYLISCAK